jgi:hypothetical protein
MSAPLFTLRVPADPAFQGLAGEVVGRYIELSGGTAAERETVTAAVTSAVDGLAGRPGEAVDVLCTPGASGLDVAVRCGGRSASLHHPRPAEKR